MQVFFFRKIDKKTIGLFLIIALAFIACSETEVGEKNNPGSSSPYSDATAYNELTNGRLEGFRKEGGLFDHTGDMQLDIGTDYIGQYKTYHSSENGLIVGYNKSRHQLEFVDVMQQKIYTSISFAREGPEGIRNVTGIYYHNKDSIFITSDFHLLMMDEQGDVKLKFRINQPNIERNDLDNFDFSSFVLIPSKGRPIHFYAPQQALIMPMHSIKYSQWTVPQFYEHPVCVKISLETRKIETIPLHYPDEYRQNSYGLANKTFFAYNKERIIVGFNNSPRLFSYDLEQETSSAHDCKSRYYQKMAPYTGSQGDSFAKTGYIEDNTIYRGLHYIPNKHRYYLISSTKEKDFPGLKFHLSTLDEELTTLCELTLPAAFPPVYLFGVPTGLAFRSHKKSTSTQSVYQIVDIDCR